MQNVKKCAIHSIFLQCNTCLISLIISKTILQFVHTIECHYQIDTIYPVVQSTSAFKYLISTFLSLHVYVQRSHSQEINAS